MLTGSEISSVSVRNMNDPVPELHEKSYSHAFSTNENLVKRKENDE